MLMCNVIPVVICIIVFTRVSVNLKSRLLNDVPDFNESRALNLLCSFSEDCPAFSSDVKLSSWFFKPSVGIDYLEQVLNTKTLEIVIFVRIAIVLGNRMTTQLNYDHIKVIQGGKI